MNAKSLITAIALSAGFAGAAFAEGPIQSNDVFVGSKTRAEVQAELSAYKQAGVNPWSTSYNPLKSFRSERSRAEVTAEYISSRAAVAAMTGEDSGASYLVARKQIGEVRHLAGQPARAQ